MDFPGVIAQAAADFGSTEALVAYDLEGRRRALTYTALHDRARRVAGRLAEAGVGHGDHVAVALPNGIEWVEAFYGAALAGAVTVPVNTRFTAREFAYCLSQSQSRVLIHGAPFLKFDAAAMLAEVRADLPDLQTVITDLSAAALPDEPPDELPPAGPADILLMQYTSGSTAFPKGVMLSHDAMLRNAAAVAARMHLGPGDRYFSPRPFFHVSGTTLSLLAALTTGATLITQARFEPSRARRVLEDERATHMSGNDTIFLEILADSGFSADRLHLRAGWAAAGPEVMAQVSRRFGMPGIAYAYGLSEAAPNVVFSDIDEPLALRVHGLARTHAGLSLRISDMDSGAVLALSHGDDNPAPMDTSLAADPPLSPPGEIQVRGWSVMRDYFDKPDETAATMTADGWLKTGDIGALTPDGRLKFLGRAKDIIRVGGENLAPVDVEEVLHAHPDIAQAQVIALPDSRLGEVPVAYVRPRTGVDLSAEDVIAHAKAHLAGFKVPRHVAIVADFEALGMTGSGKVQKRALRDDAARRFGPAG